MNIMPYAAAAFLTLLPITAAIAQPALIAQPAVPIAIPAKATLTVAFTGLASPTGTVLLAVFDSEAAFDKGGKPVREAMIQANGATIETVFAGLPAGRYAIKSFHDLDGDEKMAANPFGMPTEPFAFSNNAVANMGPAKWADAAFTVTQGANRHSIVIR